MSKLEGALSFIAPATASERPRQQAVGADVYFSADIETDGPIPGPYSMLSFALVCAGSFDGSTFERPSDYKRVFYREMTPISDRFELEALQVNGLDRERLKHDGLRPEVAMNEAVDWIRQETGGGRPVLVAFPLSFDWAWLYWYFVNFSTSGSPFSHSHCFDVKTAWAVKAGVPITQASRSRLPGFLRSTHRHSHHAVDDAISQAQIFANVFEWGGHDEAIERTPGIY